MTCEKKYSNSSDPAILKLWPTQILRRTLTLLPSETERGRRDSEIQVGSSQDNIVESLNKFAHIIVKNIKVSYIESKLSGPEFFKKKIRNGFVFITMRRVFVNFLEETEDTRNARPLYRVEEWD